MDAHIKKVYVPMTETSFYILLCLRTPNHGYGIVQKVKELTDNEVVLGPGTMYGSLSKMEKDGLIAFEKEEENGKKKYVIYFYYGNEKYAVIGVENIEKLKEIAVEYLQAVISNYSK